MSGQAHFLARAGWAEAEALPIPSDASDRSYLRLVRANGASAILMRAPVATSDVARRQFEAFRRIGLWLRDLGLGAPEEYAADAEAGLLLLEDLGETPLSRLVEEGSPDGRASYGAAAGVLAEVARATPPEGLARPGARAMAAMTDLTFERIEGAEGLRQAVQGALARHLGALDNRACVSLRDMHGDNLMWRSMGRIGILDFQDALILPDGYDIASLLDDPRRTVPEPWRRAIVAEYALARGIPEDEMAFRVDLLSVQRNLRILGIFRRLSAEMGRPAYARFQPRTSALLRRAAGHPDLADLRPLVAELLERTGHWQEDAA
jgi:N-acetylmuramate 1-kinase